MSDAYNSRLKVPKRGPSGQDSREKEETNEAFDSEVDYGGATSVKSQRRSDKSRKAGKRRLYTQSSNDSRYSASNVSHEEPPKKKIRRKRGKDNCKATRQIHEPKQRVFSANESSVPPISEQVDSIRPNPRENVKLSRRSRQPSQKAREMNVRKKTSGSRPPRS
ncbi:hypothetical protein FGB62_31g114 [Gracilaria domingensis]|nr:hypothetical protein FGB62_31g114 [Gracilaria domingensis]